LAPSAVSPQGGVFLLWNSSAMIGSWLAQVPGFAFVFADFAPFAVYRFFLMADG